MFSPKVPQAPSGSQVTQCALCRQTKPQAAFPISKAWHQQSLHCNNCIIAFLKKNKFTWQALDVVCQDLNIPFLPKEFEELQEVNGDKAFPIYAKTVSGSPYTDFDWSDYYNRYLELKELDTLDRELPLLHEEEVRQLQRVWGANYDEVDLVYLQDLYDGMVASLPINSALSIDQARKLCKMSLILDEKIRSRQPIDKDMASYDKLVKTAEFTPKNTRNDNDLDTFSEAALWLEKRGWVNRYYDGVKRDVVDETIQSIQAFTQRLYLNEAGIGEEITERLKALQAAQAIQKEADDYFGLNEKEVDLEEYDNTSYESYASKGEILVLEETEEED